MASQPRARAAHAPTPPGARRYGARCTPFGFSIDLVPLPVASPEAGSSVTTEAGSSRDDAEGGASGELVSVEPAGARDLSATHPLQARPRARARPCRCPRSRARPELYPL